MRGGNSHLLVYVDGNSQWMEIHTRSTPERAYWSSQTFAVDTCSDCVSRHSNQERFWIGVELVKFAPKSDQIDASVYGIRGACNIRVDPGLLELFCFLFALCLFVRTIF